MVNQTELRLQEMLSCYIYPKGSLVFVNHLLSLPKKLPVLLILVIKLLSEEIHYILKRTEYTHHGLVLASKNIPGTEDKARRNYYFLLYEVKTTQHTTTTGNKRGTNEISNQIMAMSVK